MDDPTQCVSFDLKRTVQLQYCVTIRSHTYTCGASPLSVSVVQSIKRKESEEFRFWLKDRNVNVRRSILRESSILTYMRLHCVECGAPQLPSQRACVLVPCGHLIHDECASFLRKRQKLTQQFVKFDTEGRILPLPPLLASDSDQFKCPGCSCDVRSTVALFLPEGTLPTSSVADGAVTRTAPQQDRIFHLQRKFLMRTKEFTGVKQETTRVVSRCAALHEEVNSLQKSVDATYERMRAYAATVATPESHQDASSNEASALESEEKIRSLGRLELTKFVHSVSSQLLREGATIDSLRKQIATRQSRLRCIKQEYDRIRAASASVSVAASPPPRVATMPFAVPKIPLAVPSAAPKPISAPTQCVEFVDVDAESSGAASDEDDVEVVQDVTHLRKRPSKSGSSVVGDDVFEEFGSTAASVAHRGAVRTAWRSAPTAQSPSVCAEGPRLLPCTVRRLPHYGMSTGLSLRDLPNRQAALFQSTVENFLPH